MPPPTTTASADCGSSPDVSICCSGARMVLSALKRQFIALRRQSLLQLRLEQNFIPAIVLKSRVLAFQSRSARIDRSAGCDSLDGHERSSILCCRIPSRRQPVKLDRIDIKILHELQKNGRITNVELAELVHLSPSPCLMRVKRLQSEGYIEGYSAQVNIGKLGQVLTVFT